MEEKPTCRQNLFVFNSISKTKDKKQQIRVGCENAWLFFLMECPILYPEFLALLAKYLCQHLTVLQEYCKMAKFLKYNKLATLVVKIPVR
jgi:hypothetical protein